MRSALANGRTEMKTMKVVLLLQFSSALLFFSSTVLSQSVTVELDVVGLTENQLNLNTALQNTCATIGAASNATELLAACNLLLPLDGGDVALASALDQLTPEETFAISDSLTFAGNTPVSSVFGRLNTIRTNTLGPYLTGILINDDRNTLVTGGAAAFDLGGRRLELFASGQFASGDIKGKQLQQNVDFSNSGFNLGVDIKPTDNNVTGISLGFLQHESEFSDSAGRVEVDGYNLTLFTTFYSEKYGYVDGVLDIGGSEFDLSREIAIQGLSAVTTLGSTDSTNYSLTVGVGKFFNFTGWEIGPYARLGYASSSVDGYQEQINSGITGTGLALNISSQTVKSTTFTLGATASLPISTSTAVFVPQISVEFEVEADSEKDPFSAFFLADPNQTVFTVAGDDRDSNYGNLDLGTTAVFTNGRSAYAFYQTRFADSQVTQNSINVGARFEF